MNTVFDGNDNTINSARLFALADKLEELSFEVCKLGVIAQLAELRGEEPQEAGQHV